MYRRIVGRSCCCCCCGGGGSGGFDDKPQLLPIAAPAPLHASASLVSVREAVVAAVAAAEEEGQGRVPLDPLLLMRLLLLSIVHARRCSQMAGRGAPAAASR